MEKTKRWSPCVLSLFFLRGRNHLLCRTYRHLVFDGDCVLFVESPDLLSFWTNSVLIVEGHVTCVGRHHFTQREYSQMSVHSGSLPFIEPSYKYYRLHWINTRVYSIGVSGGFLIITLRLYLLPIDILNTIFDLGFFK